MLLLSNTNVAPHNTCSTINNTHNAANTKHTKISAHITGIGTHNTTRTRNIKHGTMSTKYKVAKQKQYQDEKARLHVYMDDTASRAFRARDGRLHGMQRQ